MTLTPEIITEYTDKIGSTLVNYFPRLATAIIILIVGIYAIRVIKRIAQKIMVQRQFEPTLSKFLADILIWALRVLLFVIFITQLGVETSAFVAVLGAAGLAIGLSLQGSMSNFAGGMLIIAFKPFRVGDTIEAQNVIGTVSEIQIFVTKLTTGNNQTIFIPNGALSNNTIINYSMAGTRRADLLFSIAYDADLKHTKEIIQSVLKANDKVLKDPEPAVVVDGLTDNAVRLAIRPWANNADYGLMVSEVLEDVKLELQKAGIETQPFVKESSKK